MARTHRRPIQDFFYYSSFSGRNSPVRSEQASHVKKPQFKKKHSLSSTQISLQMAPRRPRGSCHFEKHSKYLGPSRRGLHFWVTQRRLGENPSSVSVHFLQVIFRKKRVQAGRDFGKGVGFCRCGAPAFDR